MPSPSPQVRRHSMLWVGMLAAALLLIGLHYQAGDHSPLERASLAALHPLNRVMERAWDLLGRPGQWFKEVRSLRQERDRLRVQVDRLQRQAQSLLEAHQELQRLRQLLHLKPESETRYLTARVIGYPPLASGKRTLLLEVGRRDGVLRGALGLAQGGVVGWIVKVGDFSSLLLLLTDPAAHIAAMVQTREGRHPAGVCQGTGQDELVMSYLPSNIPIRPGDLVITSGLGSVFQTRGLPIGRVVSVQVEAHTSTLRATLKPLVALDHLEEVLLLLPRQEILPEAATMEP